MFNLSSNFNTIYEELSLLYEEPATLIEGRGNKEKQSTVGYYIKTGDNSIFKAPIVSDMAWAKDVSEIADFMEKNSNNKAEISKRLRDILAYLYFIDRHTADPMAKVVKYLTALDNPQAKQLLNALDKLKPSLDAYIRQNPIFQKEDSSLVDNELQKALSKIDWKTFESKNCEKISCIYIIRNIKTGQLYIGQTTNLRGRIKSYIDKAKYDTCGHTIVAALHDNLENFRWGILETVDPPKYNPVQILKDAAAGKFTASEILLKINDIFNALDAAEMDAIRKYNTLDNLFNYNMDVGGRDIVTLYRKLAEDKDLQASLFKHIFARYNQAFRRFTDAVLPKVPDGFYDKLDHNGKMAVFTHNRGFRPLISNITSKSLSASFLDTAEDPKLALLFSAAIAWLIEARPELSNGLQTLASHIDSQTKKGETFNRVVTLADTDLAESRREALLRILLRGKQADSANTYFLTPAHARLALELPKGFDGCLNTNELSAAVLNKNEADLRLLYKNKTTDFLIDTADLQEACLQVLSQYGLSELPRDIATSTIKNRILQNKDAIKLLVEIVLEYFIKEFNSEIDISCKAIELAPELKLTFDFKVSQKLSSKTSVRLADLAHNSKAFYTPDSSEYKKLILPLINIAKTRSAADLVKLLPQASSGYNIFNVTNIPELADSLIKRIFLTQPDKNAKRPVQAIVAVLVEQLTNFITKNTQSIEADFDDFIARLTKNTLEACKRLNINYNKDKVYDLQAELSRYTTEDAARRLQTYFNILYKYALNDDHAVDLQDKLTQYNIKTSNIKALYKLCCGQVTDVTRSKQLLRDIAAQLIVYSPESTKELQALFMLQGSININKPKVTKSLKPTVHKYDSTIDQDIESKQKLCQQLLDKLELLIATNPEPFLPKNKPREAYKGKGQESLNLFEWIYNNLKKSHIIEAYYPNSDYTLHTNCKNIALWLLKGTFEEPYPNRNYFRQFITMLIEVHSALNMTTEFPDLTIFFVPSYSHKTKK